MHVFVTGAAGFIGFHLAKRLLEEGNQVFGIDNLNAYYDPQLKADRLDILRKLPGFVFRRLDLVDREGMKAVFAEQTFDAVVHLAAQAGVRYSLENPYAYIDSNITGFMNILEGCRSRRVPHLVFASSSSVYGANTKMPFSVHDNVDHPVSLYAATKKANELMAHTYAHLYGLPCTGLRFFTVYGPWGRPDMALFKFTKAILEDSAIDIYNRGDMERDFTYVDDIIEALVRVMRVIPEPSASWDGLSPDPGTSSAPYRIYNIGGSRPVKLMDFIRVLEDTIGKKARKNLLPLQKGDVVATWADARDLESAVGFTPRIPVEEGIGRFIRWYRDYYRV
ncbi:MAG: dTDP-glucose 4,6-dehydratase [Deltaproteobacteria bacterium ADurb.BinA179]|jgi:UDP-glucuronate 4-epimerase|nr:NAD-dependent epimerase [Deltaproteobacteria bacterium]MDI9543973.1 NAD-dependent epimerase [Pseudomonadota bacterium]NLW66397.1 NAD-dependent epimerase [Bacteriovoracaceae bacterium]OPZ29268.1 MAG: dTDP-glucose 4,6-dehydratase [Deltaproteobacteria bacterium ADurb.BinA179]HRR21922.1 NAD-dependent epimerase [Desulfomonilia bacterium]